ncbi:uroporphyrinogen-III C-methyltransferase [Pukyongiella litopenaei]|uniref:uroporphyrinogen-III C-methyltransferase n=1 Tax=Pukyongiella litopenaei TaxID=2605946 RepID=A0A2S0MM83_9RHOB|nr:uroporphyrinogen-III C-methyltransferase [Pukyongiella litopenaei]AVO36995.1 uroporphyrinogen-III C-methyltransferase [Pukyongiella litopenaei]
MPSHRQMPPGPHPVAFVGAGPGDPGLLTLNALHALQRAEVILHDRLASPAVLALANPDAQLIETGKTGFAPSTPQGDINTLIVAHARRGMRVVRLKSGDPAIFSRLDEEIAACDAAGLPWTILPGITAASAAAAALGQSLTRRDRNSALRLLTGHDVNGFAEQDWVALARPGTVAAIYMGKKTARFLQGRLLMHGADPATPVTVVENASRPGQRIVATALATLPADLDAAALGGPAITMLGLAPRKAVAALPELQKERA